MKTEITSEDLQVVFEDNHVIVVVKPQDIPSCPDDTGDMDMLTLVKDYLKKKYNKPGDAYVGLVHRLDRPTGGVMVFAKTSKAAARLCEGMRNGEFEKKYFAIVVGTPKEKAMLNVTHYLVKDSSKNMVYAVPMATEGAQKAVLDYNLLESKDSLSLLSIRLHTGRAHQIRVQMKTLGMPLFGDYRYGEGKSPIGFHLALWATELKFIHPVTKDKMVFRVYPPVDQIPWKYFDVSRFLSVSIKYNY